ncbi:hypothetical protein NYE69_07040 [Paenibacillus sp. FSL R5-0527]|uniref:hypothetical protein n=1 Tax=Paenibacillus sp. FSL R5-0527 TaxID=2975321 RepID=UPI00097AEFCF|nr:hypothetical protein BK140_09440 [Paenibacillus macerans]
MPYVQVDQGIVMVVSSHKNVPDAENIFEVDSFDTSLLGKRRLADGTFEEVPRQEPTQEPPAE